MFQTKNNVIGIVEFVTSEWPAEQKERLIRELKAANVENSSGKTGTNTLDKG